MLYQLYSAAEQAVAAMGPFGYQPNLGAPIVFTIVYGLTTLAHTFQTIQTKQWWQSSIAFGCLCETTGNAIRIYGHFHQYVVNPYIAQQVLLVLTPAFFAAADFTILGRIISCMGDENSLVRAKIIIPFFVSIDIISLIIQGIGSGIAATAEIDAKDTMPGGRIVVGGLALQLVGYLIFNVIYINFWIRCQKNPPKSEYWNNRFQFFMAVVFVSSLLIFLRSTFRLAEMAVGWIGYIATTEWYYYAWDATPVSIAVILLVICNPGYYLPRNYTWRSGLAAETPKSKGEDVEAGHEHHERPDEHEQGQQVRGTDETNHQSSYGTEKHAEGE